MKVYKMCILNLNSTLWLIVGLITFKPSINFNANKSIFMTIILCLFNRFTLTKSVTDLGNAIVWSDSNSCDLSDWSFDNSSTWVTTQYTDGPGEGHAKCLYGAYDPRNTAIYRTFLTNHLTPYIVRINARIYLVCTADAGIDSVSVEITVNNSVNVLWTKERSSISSCAGWSSHSGSAIGWLSPFSACESSFPNTFCYTDISLFANVSTNNFTVKFVGITTQPITDEAWAVTDILLDINEEATHLGTSKSWIDPAICDTNRWIFDDDTYMNNHTDGPGQGHTTCVWGPFDTSNQFLQREFVTSFSPPLSITVNARFWTLQTFEDYEDFIQINVTDSTGIKSIIKTTRTHNNCSKPNNDWTEYIGSGGWLNGIGTPYCYIDVSVPVNIESQNCIITFYSILNGLISDESWGLSDVSIDINTNNPTLTPTNNPTVNPTPVPTHNDYLKSITTLSPTTLPIATFGGDAVYDSLNDVIWLFPGTNTTFYLPTSQTYDYRNEIFTQENGTNGVTLHADADFMQYYDGIIYIADFDDHKLYQIDVNTQVFSTRANYPQTRDNVCLGISESRKLLFILNDANDRLVWIYNISSDTWDQTLPDILSVHQFGACNTYDNPNDNQLYLYSFGGVGITDIEKLNVDNPSSWSVVDNLFSTTYSRRSVNIANGIIYIIGGWNGTTGDTTIEIFNAEKDIVYTSSVTLNTGVGLASCVYVPPENRVFVFGGLVSPGVATGAVQVSNILETTAAPTSNPTINPTVSANCYIGTYTIYCKPTQNNFNFTEARDYCMNVFNRDMLTIFNASVEAELDSQFDTYGGVISWIGLVSDSLSTNANDFYWIADGSTTSVHSNWAPLEPTGDGKCVEIVSPGTANTWNDNPCFSSKAGFFCNGPNTQSPTMTPTSAPTVAAICYPADFSIYCKTTAVGFNFTQARDYCMSRFTTDLVSIHNSTVYNEINDSMETYGAVSGWIGLVSDTFTTTGTDFYWIDNTSSNFYVWDTNLGPEPTGDGKCVEWYDIFVTWNDVSCSALKGSFVCNGIKTQNPSMSPTPVPTNVDPLVSMEVLNYTAPAPLYGGVTVYDDLNDVIWLIGGFHNPSYYLTTYTLDYNTGIFTQQNDTISNVFTNGRNGFYYNGKIYMTNTGSHIIYEFDVMTQNMMVYASFSSYSFANPCFAMSKTRELLFVIDSLSVNSIMYNMSNNSWSSLVGSSSVHDRGCCATYNNPNDDQLYLYVFGGVSTTTSEALNVDSNIGWNYVDNVDNTNYARTVVSLDNGYIYIFGGWTGNTEVIIVFNAENNNLYVSSVSIPSPFGFGAGTYVPALSQIYLIGGAIAGSTGQDVVQATNSLGLTIAPTQVTGNPTLYPSQHPSLYPTDYPSQSPIVNYLRITMHVCDLSNAEVSSATFMFSFIDSFGSYSSLYSKTFSNAPNSEFTIDFIGEIELSFIGNVTGFGMFLGSETDDLCINGTQGISVYSSYLDVTFDMNVLINSTNDRADISSTSRIYIGDDCQSHVHCYTDLIVLSLDNIFSNEYTAYGLEITTTSVSTDGSDDTLWLQGIVGENGFVSRVYWNIIGGLIPISTTTTKYFITRDIGNFSSFTIGIDGTNAICFDSIGIFKYDSSYTFYFHDFITTYINTNDSGSKICLDGDCSNPLICSVAYNIIDGTSNPTLQPSTSPASSNCGYSIDYHPDVYTDWVLVRRVRPGKAWHPATDNLALTDVYCDTNNSYICNGNDANANATFSIAYDINIVDQFLFTDGTCQNWLITTPFEAINNFTFYESSTRNILKSSISNTSYSAIWLFRSAAPEDPWMSVEDHGVSVTNNNLVYGENGFAVALSLCMNFNNNINDYSSWNHSIRVNNSENLEFSPYGSLKFKGGTSSLIIPNHRSLNMGWEDYSIKFRAKFNSTRVAMRFMSQGANGCANPGWMVRTTNFDQLLVEAVPNNECVGPSINEVFGSGLDGEWHNYTIVVNRNEESVTTYIDGVNETVLLPGIAIDNFTNPNLDVHIGYNPVASSEPLNGEIDYLCVFQRSLPYNEAIYPLCDCSNFGSDSEGGNLCTPTNSSQMETWNLVYFFIFVTNKPPWWGTHCYVCGWNSSNLFLNKWDPTEQYIQCSELGGHITSINFRGLNLGGSLNFNNSFFNAFPGVSSEYLFWPSNLESFDISNNNLTGEFKLDIFSKAFNSLLYFDISNNKFGNNGETIDWNLLSNFSKLSYVNISNNLWYNQELLVNVNSNVSIFDSRNILFDVVSYISINGLLFVDISVPCNVLTHCISPLCVSGSRISESCINLIDCQSTCNCSNCPATSDPTQNPTSNPTTEPSQNPSVNPTSEPSLNPSANPSSEPSLNPSVNPTLQPSLNPSINPTTEPSQNPNVNPTSQPSLNPSVNPTTNPTSFPTNNPTNFPSDSPTSAGETNDPTVIPTTNPTQLSQTPTAYPSETPSKRPTLAPTSSPTTSPTDLPSELTMRISNSLSHGKFNPNTKFTFSVSGSYSGSDASNITADITWFCGGCSVEWSVLDSDDSHIQLYEERFSNSTTKVYFYSLLTLNSDSWNGVSLLSIDLCKDGYIFTPGSAYTIGANLTIYSSSNVIIASKRKQRLVQSNPKPMIPPYICNIHPRDGVSLLTNFKLTCNDTLANILNERLLYNFFSNTFMTHYKVIGDGFNHGNDSFATVLGTGNHSIRAVLLDKNNYGVCFKLPSVSVTLEVKNTSQLLSIVDDFVDGISGNLSDSDPTEVVTNQISVVETLTDYANDTNLSANDVGDLVDVQETLINNIDFIVSNNNTNISSDELLTIAGSLETLTNPIVENEVVNVTSRIISGNISVETPSKGLENITVGELESFLLDALVATTEYKEEELTVVVIDIKENLNVSVIIYYVEYDGNINTNVNTSNITIVVDAAQQTIEIDTDLLLHELQEEQPFVFTSTSRLSEEGFAILANINSASYYSSAYAAAVSNVVVNVVDELSDSLIENEEPLDSSTAEALVTAVENLVEIRGGLGNGKDEFASDSGDNTVALLTTVGQLVLLDSEVGSEVTITTDKITLGATRFERENPNCPDSATPIELSQEYVDGLGSGTSNMDCVISKQSDNAYDPSESRDEIWSGFFVNLDVDEPIKNKRNPKGRRLKSLRNKRRRLPDNSYGNSSQYLDKCSPILITIDNQQVMDWNATYPKCLFWNTTTEEYEDNGCYVLTKDATKSICACLHATYFGVSQDDFSVQANPITLSTFADFTWGNFKDHPAGIITAGLVVIVCVSMMYIIPGKDDKPLLAHHRAIHKNYIDNNDRKYNYRVIADRNIFDDKERSTCSKMYGLWINTMKNEHEIISLFFRHKGTGYTGKQRIAMLLMKLMTILAVNGVFYGNEQSSAYGDILVSVYGTLLSLPPTILKMIFLKYHMKERKHEWKSKTMKDLFKNTFGNKKASNKLVLFATGSENVNNDKQDDSIGGSQNSRDNSNDKQIELQDMRVKSNSQSENGNYNDDNNNELATPMETNTNNEVQGENNVDIPSQESNNLPKPMIPNDNNNNNNNNNKKTKNESVSIVVKDEFIQDILENDLNYDVSSSESENENNKKNKEKSNITNDNKHKNEITQELKEEESDNSVNKHGDLDLLGDDNEVTTPTYEHNTTIKLSDDIDEIDDINNKEEEIRKELQNRNGIGSKFKWLANKLGINKNNNNNNNNNTENNNENPQQISDLEIEKLIAAVSTNTSPLLGETDEYNNENEDSIGKDLKTINSEEKDSDSFDDVLQFALGNKESMNISNNSDNSNNNNRPKFESLATTSNQISSRRKKKLSLKEKEEILDHVRKKVLKKNRTCPYWFKYIAWSIIVIWTLGCSFLALYWAIRFDQVLAGRNESYQSECENGLDMSELDRFNFNATVANITKWLKNTDPSVFDPPKSDSFGENITSTNRWLLSIATSYAMSVFITGPIIAFILQLKRILTYKPDQVNEEYFFSLYHHFI